MTKKVTVMVGLAGIFPLVNIDNNRRIEAGPATEVELTPWVEGQLAAGSLVKFEAEADAEAEKAEAEKAEAEKSEAEAEKAAAASKNKR